MTETSDMWREINAERAERHAEWKKKNLEILRESGIPFTDKGETLLFRQEGKPKVDFYPSTGRWKVKGEFMRGGAKSFLRWYRRQNTG